jgi:ATP-dependent RNA helicase DeaD
MGWTIVDQQIAQENINNPVLPGPTIGRLRNCIRYNVLKPFHGSKTKYFCIKFFTAINWCTFADYYFKYFMLNFQELGLSPELQQAVAILGFSEPMPVQAAIIPILLENPVDLVGLAQTGTGKTAAFGLPILQHIDTTMKKTQALVLCPTRELCLQITRDIGTYAEYMPKVKVVAVYGGASIEAQFKQLSDTPHIIVATPGRMNDMIRRKKADLSHVKWAVLDEADEMLDMGFQEDVDAILQSTPAEKHTLLFSATMPAQVERILAKYMRDPVIKTIGQRNKGTANVRHIYYLVQARDRYPALKRIADFNPRIYAIVFCRTRRETQEVADWLIRDGYNADALHGDLSQAQRDSVMTKFRNRNLQLLIATDVAARGLDVNDLTHVINYNLPDEAETYIHRSGRTGRADKKGTCISIINLREKGKIKHISKLVGQEFAKAKIPTGFQVCEKQLFHMIDNMENVDLKNEEIDSFLPVIYRKLEWMEREDIIKRFVSLEFNNFLDYYRDAQDLNVDESAGFNKYDIEEKRDTKRRRPVKSSPGRTSFSGSRQGGAEPGYTRLFFSVGRKDKVAAPQLIGLVNEVTRTRDVKIGRIEIKDNFSFLEVSSDSFDLVMESFSNLRLNKTGVHVEPAEPRGDSPDKKGKKEKRSKEKGGKTFFDTKRKGKSGRR